jgi:ATP-dependent Lon protease
MVPKRNGQRKLVHAFEKELSQAAALNPASGEYSVQVNYVHILLELPWGEYTKDNFDLKRGRRYWTGTISA